MVGDGQMSHDCLLCGLRVTVGVPDGPEPGGKRWWNVVLAQVPWPALCEGCWKWWNTLALKGGGKPPAKVREALNA